MSGCFSLKALSSDSLKNPFVQGTVPTSLFRQSVIASKGRSLNDQP